MNLSFGSLMGSLLVSGVGYALFQYGRKRSRSMAVIFGIIMMIYPYFIPDFYWMVGIAAGMCAILYWLIQSGY